MAMALCFMFVFKLCTRGPLRRARLSLNQIRFLYKNTYHYYCKAAARFFLNKIRKLTLVCKIVLEGGERRTTPGGSHVVENFSHGRYLLQIFSKTLVFFYCKPPKV